MKYSKPAPLDHSGWFIGVVCLHLIIPLSAFGDTVTLKPAADTALFQNAPANNLGAQDFMPVGLTSLGSRTRGLVRFDFAGNIPSNAVINSATLTLRVVVDRGGSPIVDLHRMLRPWIEGNKSGGPSGGGTIGAPASTNEPTWNRRAHPGTAWGTPGAQASSDYVSTASTSGRVTSGQILFTNAGLVADLQTFVSNGATNFGWLIKNQSETTSGARRIGSRENTSSSPKLVVNFTVPQTAPLTIASPSPLPNGTVGVPYSFTMTATNGTPPLSWSVISGTPPGGIDLSSAGELTGTPTNAGDFNFTAQVMDNAGAVTNNAFALTISPPLRFDQVNVAGNQIRIQFAAQASQPYAVDFRASLSAGDWLTLTNIAAQPITSSVVITDLISEASRFYRLRTP